MSRRELLENALIGAAALGKAETSTPVENRAAVSVASALDVAERQEIYRLLGFATMSGEDPLKLWARLRNTNEWLAGPLAPDAWPGQVFTADHCGIFAFRFMSLPAAWMAPAGAKDRASYCAQQWSTWGQKWPD